MGQRHQLFVIARVNGRYRCLGAIHHQWLYGHTALRRCLAILKIFQDAKNRVALSEELKKANAADEDLWSEKQDDNGTNCVHFPFVMTCLILGASTSVEENYYHVVSVAPFGMAYNEGDNNDGITIFDISDPARPSYCFVNFDGLEGQYEVQLMAPLSARVYLGAYYRLTDPEHEYLLPLLAEFKKWPIISTEALKNTWEHEGWEKPSEIESADGDERAAQAPKEGSVTSLRSLTVNQLAEAIVNLETEDLETSEDLHVITDLWPKVKEKLYARAANLVASAEGLENLFKSLQRDSFVDLSPFTSIPSSDLCQLACRLFKEGAMESLNLSGRIDLDLSFLKGSAKFKSLYLMGNSESLDSIAEFRPNYDIYHTELLARPLVDRRDNESHTRRGIFEPPPSLPILDFHEPTNVKHLAYVSLSTNVYTEGQIFLANGGINWDFMMHDSELSPGIDFSLGLRCRKFPLQDVPMPFTRLVIGLFNFLKLKPSTSLAGTRGVYKLLGSALAIGGQITGSPDIGVGIGPLSTELYAENGITSIKGASLAPGQWALLIIDPLCRNTGSPLTQRLENLALTRVRKEVIPLDRLQYAFIQHPKDGETQFRVVDAVGYLKSLGTMEARKWASACEGNNEWAEHFYQAEDVQNIIRNVYDAKDDEPEEQEDCA